MITIVEGKIGDGKSYHLVTLMSKHLCAGGIVATNMTLSLDELRKVFRRRIDSRQVIHVSAASSPFEIPRGDFRGRGRRRVMVVLDEALNWFASSAGAKDERKSTWGEWLRQSDKLGQDVYFIAQNFERAAKWIRELAQVLISIKNLKNVTLFRLPLGNWLKLRFFYVASKYDLRAAMLVGWAVHHIDIPICRCYETAELYGFPASANAYDGLTVFPPFRLPVWPVVVFVLFVLVAWVWL